MTAEPAGSVAGILLAAGSSARMGRNKLLLTFGGESVLRRAARRAVAVLDPVIVVLGREADRMRAELAGLPCRAVVSRQYARGMRASLRAGLAAVPADAPAAVILLADMPLVTSAMINALVDRFRASRAPLVISRYGDAVAPPHLYARPLLTELARAEGRGREVIRRHQGEAEVLSWPATALTDLDVPADRDRVEALLASEP